MTWFLVLHTLFAAVLVWWDVRHRKIPNWLAGTWAVATTASLWLLPPGDLIWRVSCAVLLSGLALWGFAKGRLGGGDVKALPIIAVLAPFSSTSAGCFGLAFLLSYLNWRRHPRGLPLGAPLGLGLILSLIVAAA